MKILRSLVTFIIALYYIGPSQISLAMSCTADLALAQHYFEKAEDDLSKFVLDFSTSSTAAIDGDFGLPFGNSL